MTPFSFATAGKTEFGRGSAADAVNSALAFGRRVFLLRGGSVAWVDQFEREVIAASGQLQAFRLRAEPDLATLEACIAQGRAHRPDLVVAIGGGSVIDLGKASAALIPGPRPPLAHLEVVGDGLPLDVPPLPFIALPTTSGTGAEATKNAVISVPEAGRKVSLRDDRMLPDLTIVDPALTDGCPRNVTLASGMDAITQVIEPYLCSRANPMTDALCRDAIPRGLAAIATLMAGEDAEARDDMALTSLTGGIALANAGLGAVHGVAGVLGGRVGAHHGALCGRLLPPVLRANRQACMDTGDDVTRFDEVFRWIAAALGGEPASAPETLAAHLNQWGLPRLSQIMPPGTDLAEVADAAKRSSSMQANPFPLTGAALVQALEAAL